MYLAVAAVAGLPLPPEADPAVDVLGVPEDDDDDGCFFPSFSQV